MPFYKKKFAAFLNILITLLAGAVIVVAIAGPVLGMTNHEMGCPFSVGGSGMCPMNIYDHLDKWDQLFTFTMPSLFVFAVFSFLFCLKFFISAFAFDPIPATHFGYLRGHPPKGRNWRLENAFRKGIIHPILYA